jgi:dTDP-glucose 4,6-dehydratase
VADLEIPDEHRAPDERYVEGQQLHRVIPKAILCALKGEKLPLQGGGRAVKSYLHARDLSRAVVQVIEDAPFGTIYNVGPDEPISIRALVALVAEACGKSLDQLATDVADRVGQDARYHLDCSAVKGLGWKQTIGLVKASSAWSRGRSAFPELLTYDTAYQHRA